MNDSRVKGAEKQGALKRFINYAACVIENVENSKLPFYHFIFIAFCVLMLRNVLENFTAASGITLTIHLHFTLFGIFTVLLLIFISRLFTGCDPVKAFKLFSTFLFLILVGLVVDVITALGGVRGIAYLHIQDVNELIRKFFMLTGQYTGKGVTHGMKLHVGTIIFFLLLYVYIKTGGRLLRGILAGLSVYTALYILAVTPFLFEMLGFKSTNELFILFYFIGSVVLMVVLFYLSNRKFFIAVLKDMRPYRTVHYISMFFLGIVVAATEDRVVYPDYFWGIVSVFIIAILAAGVFSIITNNFADRDTDSVSNPDRPLVKQNIPVEHYKTLSYASLPIALCGAAFAGYTPFLLFFVSMGLYYLYSMPPVRFKRVPVLSKAVISLNSLFLALAGYSLLLPDPTDLTGFPAPVIGFFLIPFTLAVNFIDIKDYEGDKQAGIMTLPVLLGLKWSKRVTGVFFFFAYMFAGLVFPKLWVYCLIAGAVQFVLINRKNYSEHPVFILYLLSMISFIIMLYFGVVAV